VRIELHIERVVLDGVDRRHAAAVREALTSELGRLVAAAPAGSWQRSRLVRRIGAPPVTPVGDPVGLGKGIAASVYGGLTGNGGVR
jgi:hypothetical protein